MSVQWKVATQRMSIGYESGSDYTDPPTFKNIHWIRTVGSRLLIEALLTYIHDGKQCLPNKTLTATVLVMHC